MTYTIHTAAGDIIEAVSCASPLAAEQLWRAVVKLSTRDAYVALMQRVEDEERNGYTCPAWAKELEAWREVAR